MAHKEEEDKRKREERRTMAGKIARKLESQGAPERKATGAGGERQASRPSLGREPQAIKVQSEHIVASGETLAGIAERYYGSRANWTAIYEANVHVIGGNPNVIRAGQVLKIPKLN